MYKHNMISWLNVRACLYCSYLSHDHSTTLTLLSQFVWQGKEYSIDECIIIVLNKPTNQPQNDKTTPNR